MALGLIKQEQGRRSCRWKRI